jgi:hypothetical protein
MGSVLTEGCVKFLDHFLCSSDQLEKPDHDLQIVGDFLNLYLDGKLSVNVYFSFRSHSLETDLADYVLTFERVGSDVLDVRKCSRRGERNKRSVRPNHSPNKVHLPMTVGGGSPIYHEQVVCNFVSAFTSVARLYRIEPYPEVVREWKFLKCGIFETVGSFADREIHVPLAYLGGNLGAATQSICLPHGPIQGSPQLIEVFAEHERQIPLKEFIGNEFDDTIPIIPHLMSDSIGFVTKKFDVGVCERPRMVLRPSKAIVAFNEQ